MKNPAIETKQTTKSDGHVRSGPIPGFSQDLDLSWAWNNDLNVTVPYKSWQKVLVTKNNTKGKMNGNNLWVLDLFLFGFTSEQFKEDY